MLRNDRRVAIACWLFAGLPIFITFIQSLIALSGIDAVNLPVIGGIKEMLDTVTVLDVAGDIFRDNDITVFLLFILIALSWGAVGIGMLVLRDRQKTYAAAGLVTLFFVLFVLVYAELFVEDIPTIQRIGFMIIPVATVSALWISVTSYEWTATLKDETTELLSEARKYSSDARETFTRHIQQEADTKTLEWISRVTPDAVEAYNQTVDEFQKRCENIQHEADKIVEGNTGTTSQERLQRAKQLRDEAQSLAPEQRANTVLETLRTSLAQELRTEFGDETILSTYGKPYTVRNMARYNELNVPELQGPPVQIGGDAHELGDRLAEMIDSGRPLSDIARAVDRVNHHIEELTDEIRRRESTFDEQLADVEQSLNDAQDALSRIEPAIGGRLEEMLFEKRFGEREPPFPTAIDVDEQIEAAKADLHQCRSDRAQRTLNDAAADADQIKQIAMFFSDSVISTIQHGSGSIPIPEDVGKDIIEQMQTEIQQGYDVDYAIEGSELRIETAKDEVMTPKPETPTQEKSSRSSTTVPPEDVLYLLRELRQAASESSSNGTVTIQLGDYPEKFADEELFKEIKSFCSRQSQISTVELPDADPGYIKLVVDDDTSASHALTTLCERYRKQHI